MMYIQLSLPYRDYDKVKIKTIHIYEDSIAVTYSVKNNANNLFEKTFQIGSDQPKFSELMTLMPLNNFTTIENLHKIFLEYMIEQNIETGTLEVE